MALRNYLKKVGALFPPAHPERFSYLPPEADQNPVIPAKAGIQKGTAPYGLPP